MSTVPEVAQELRRWVEETPFGTLRPLAVSAALDEDVAGQVAVFLDVTLPAPDPRTGTWPIEQVLALHESVDARAKELGLELPWYVRLLPPASEEDDPVDTEEE